MLVETDFYIHKEEINQTNRVIYKINELTQCVSQILNIIKEHHRMVSNSGVIYLNTTINNVHSILV